MKMKNKNNCWSSIFHPQHCPSPFLLFFIGNSCFVIMPSPNIARQLLVTISYIRFLTKRYVRFYIDNIIEVALDLFYICDDFYMHNYFRIL